MKSPNATKVGKVNVLGVLVDATSVPEASDRIMAWVAEDDRTYVCVTGMHGIMESQRQQDLKLIHNAAGLVTADGMPLVYLSRAAGYHHCERVYGPDLMLEVCAATVERGYSHFFFGTTSETLDRLTKSLSTRFPGLRVAGKLAPPFRPMTRAERDEAINEINQASPDIVWVGLSTPKQERWMAEHRELLEAPVLIGVGAAFDFNSGTMLQAPSWIQPLCLEWLFRVFVEPRRLWRRYFINIPQFLFLLAVQRLGLRRY